MAFETHTTCHFPHEPLLVSHHDIQKDTNWHNGINWLYSVNKAILIWAYFELNVIYILSSVTLSLPNQALASILFIIMFADETIIANFL